MHRANAAFCRFSGRTDAELAGVSFADIDPSWPHGDPATAFADLRERRSTGHATRLRRPDGTLCPVQIHLNYMSLGGLESLFGVAVDTAARQAAEDALAASEARYRAVTADQTEFIVRILPNHAVTFCNPAYARLVGGGRPEDLVGRPVRQLVLEEDVGRIDDLLNSLTPEDPVATIENLVPTGDGEVWVSWVVRALFDQAPDGTQRLREFQCVGRDVSESRAILDRLSTAERRYRSLVEDSPELVSRWAPGGGLSFANRTYREFFGLPSGALRGHNVLDALGGGQRSAAVRLMEGLRPNAPVARTVVPGRRHDGAVRQLEWVERGFFDEGGALAEVQSVGRDVTDRLEAESALVERERRHRSVLDDLSEMVNRFRPADGVITYANRAFLEAKRSTGELVVGRMTIYDHLDEHAERSARERLASVTPDEPSVRVLLPLPGPGGTTRWEEWTNRALFAPAEGDAAPEVLEFQSVGRDVTDELAARSRRRERREAAAELAKLTPRERQVLRAVTTGVTNKNIARDLDIAERTVEKHRGAAMRKLGVRSAAELIRVVILAEDLPDELPPDDPAGDA